MGMNTKVDNTKDNKMARPPALGIGFLLIRLAFGLSTAPTRKAKERTIGVVTTAIKKAPIKTKI